MNNPVTKQFSWKKILLIIIIIWTIVSLSLYFYGYFEHSSPESDAIKQKIQEKEQEIKQTQKEIDELPEKHRQELQQTSIIPENTKIKISKVEFDNKKEFIFNSLENDNIQPSLSLTPEEEKILKDVKEIKATKAISLQPSMNHITEQQEKCNNLTKELQEYENNVIILSPQIQKAKELDNKIKDKKYQKHALSTKGYNNNQQTINQLKDEIQQLKQEYKQINVREKEELLDKSEVKIEGLKSMLKRNTEILGRFKDRHNQLANTYNPQNYIQERLLKIYEITDTNKIQ